MYVPGVAVWRRVDVDSISIDINNDPKACVFALFVCLFVVLYCPHGAVLLRCRQTVEWKAHHHTVRADFLSMLADFVCSLLLLFVT